MSIFPFVPPVVPIYDDIEVLGALVQAINGANTWRRILLPASAAEPASTAERYTWLLDSLAHLAVSERKQVVAVGIEFRQAGGPIVFKVAENGPVSSKTVSHLGYIIKGVMALRRIAVDQTPETVGDFWETIRNNGAFQAELDKFQIDLLLHSWPKIKGQLRKYIPAWERVVRKLQSPHEDSPFRHLSSDEVQKLNIINKCITLLEKLEPLDANSKDSINMMKFLNVLHETCTPLLEAWERYPNKRFTIFETCNRVVGGSGGAFDTARWITKLVSVISDSLRICHLIEPGPLASFFNIEPIVVVATPGLPRIFDVNVSLADVEIVAEKVGWKSDEQSASAAPDTSNGDGSDGATARHIVLSSFYRDLGIFLLPISSSASLDPVQRHYDGYVHCEAALLIRLHGRSAGSYIGVSKLSCTMCHLYFAAYREVTGIHITTRGSKYQPAVWFLPTLETVTDEAVNGIMKAKLAEIIANHLQHLKENPTRRYTPGSKIYAL